MFFRKLRRRSGTRQQFDRQKIMACRWNKMICAKGAGESAFQPKRAAKNGSWKASIVICATNKVASVDRSGDQDNPLGSKHCQMREFDRDLIRGGHYGQPSYEPRQKAGHMAALTNAAIRDEKSLPTRSRPHMTRSGHSPKSNVS
jgi:hypothetical protein